MDQTLEGIEIIFVNDKGNDSTWQILLDYLESRKKRVSEPEIILIEHEYNKGAAAARNTGILNSRADFITFCDTDDWIDANAIKEMYNAIVHQKSDIIWTDFYYSYKNHEILSREGFAEYSDECLKSMLHEKMHGALWNKMYRRELFIDYEIKFDESASVWEDLYANIRLFYFANKIHYVPKAFYHYRQDISTSLTGQLNSKTLNDIATNTNNIINFLHGKGFDYDLLILKLASKKLLLNTTDITFFKKWKEIYSESNRFILAYKKLPIHLRIVGYWSHKEYWGLINIWIWIKKCVKQFR
jgi:glycosyltransferase involved in cell wall biosynthesis